MVQVRQNKSLSMTSGQFLRRGMKSKSLSKGTNGKDLVTQERSVAKVLRDARLSYFILLFWNPARLSESVTFAYVLSHWRIHASRKLSESN